MSAVPDHRGYLQLVPKPAPVQNERAPIGVPLRIAVAATGLETFALAAAAIGVAVYQLAGHHPRSAGDAWGVVAMASVGAIGLGLVVRGLVAGRRWAQSPAVLAQLIAVPIGGSAVGNGAILAGAPLLMCGVAALVGLLAPSTIRRFRAD